jgi:hypothetical protein
MLAVVGDHSLDMRWGDSRFFVGLSETFGLGLELITYVEFIDVGCFVAVQYRAVTSIA